MTTEEVGEATVKDYHLVDTESGEQTTLELGSPKRSGSTRIAPEIRWSGLNFKAGKANILTDVWGRVRVHVDKYHLVFLLI